MQHIVLRKLLNTQKILFLSLNLPLASSVEDPAISGKLSEADQNIVRTACRETLTWMESHTTATEDEFTRKRKQLEETCKPVTLRFYASAGAFNSPEVGRGRQFPGTNNSDRRDGGPVIEEQQELAQLGCQNCKHLALATQVYIDLCEIKRYWDVEYYFSSSLQRLYFTAKMRKSEPPSVFIPIAVDEPQSFRDLQNLISLDEDGKFESINVAIVSSDSTCVYYQVTNGLAEPAAETTKEAKYYSEKLDKSLKQNKKVLEAAALYGMPITLPKGDKKD